MALGIAMLILFILIFFISKDPLKAIYYLFLGPVESLQSFSNVIVLMIPLLFTGVGTCIIFSSNTLNLASESAFYIGGLVAAVVALAFDVPAFFQIPLVFICAMIAGGAITGIPGYLKMKTNSNELVISLMLNYVMIKIGLYVLNYFIKDYTIPGFASWKLPVQTVLPNLVGGTRIHAGLLIAVAVVLIAYFAMYKTPWGLKVRVTGTNANFARFAGINTKLTALSTQLIGGAIAGFGGAVEILGLYRRFQWVQGTNFGWDGVLLATLARNNPAYIPLAAFFLAYLRIGSDIMSRNSDVPTEVLSIVQGIIIILIIAEKLTVGIEKRALLKEAKKNLAKSAAEGEGKENA